MMITHFDLFDLPSWVSILSLLPIVFGASYNKFQGFVGFLGLSQIDLDADEIQAYLTNDTPSASADDFKTDLAEITGQNGYDAADILNAYSEAAGTGTLTATDKVWTASGGSFGPFRYVVIFVNYAASSPASEPLIAWWDHGSSISINTGESFTLDFGASVFTLS